MGPVIELCSRCGFDIPSDAPGCPGCGRENTPPLSALQVAGLALATRSVHRLPATPPRREQVPRRVTPARGARSAFDYTSLLVLVAVLGAGLGWVAHLDRYVTALPHGTAELIDTLTVAVTWASVIGLVVGLIALTARSIRRVGTCIARRLQRNAPATATCLGKARPGARRAGP